MTPFALASFFILVLVPGGQALVRFRDVADNCGGKCRTDLGLPGCRFPSNPWSLVIDPKLMSGASSSVAAVPTDYATPSGARGVEASPSSRSDVVFTEYRSLSSSFSSPSAASTSTSSSVSNSTSAPSSTSKPSSTEVSSHTNSTSSLPASSTAPPPPPAHSSSPPQLPSTSSPSPSQSHPPTSSGISNAGSGSFNAGSGASNASPGTTGVGSGSTSGPTSQSDIQAYLDGHNTVRAQHSASPLAYSQDLASKAQQWANGCIFTHSGGKLGAFGENLAAGTGDGYGISQAIKSWTDEASQYDPGNPVPSHFTQVVWKGTTQVGCALQNCDGIFSPSFGKAHFYVCEYSPQGNIIGEFSANVQA